MKNLLFSIIIGSGIAFVIFIGLAVLPSFRNHSILDTESICGQFYTIPENHSDFHTVPVLLMNTDSTGCARLTLTVNYNPSYGPGAPMIPSLSSLIRIGDYNVVSNGHSFSISQGKDSTNLFQITVIPETIDMSQYPVGSNFTVTYVIKPLSGATGFYDYSIPRLVCEHYPLAVGYLANEVNASDFSYINPLGTLCERGPYGLTSVEIAGMSYKYVTLHLIPFK